MALKTIVTVVDDLTGEESEDISTVEFALDGVDYTIDLTDKNAQELRDASRAMSLLLVARVGGNAPVLASPAAGAVLAPLPAAITARPSGLSGSGPSSTVTQ